MELSSQFPGLEPAGIRNDDEILKKIGDEGMVSGVTMPATSSRTFDPGGEGDEEKLEGWWERDSHGEENWLVASPWRAHHRCF